MTALCTGGQFQPIASAAREVMTGLIEKLEPLPQVKLRTEHHLYAGCYSRTIYVPKGTIAVSVLISVPTQLVVSGDVEFTNGVDDPVQVHGYQVFEGAPFRQMAAFAREDTAMTMFFATDAKTVEEAEAEFTPEPERLQTRRVEQICRE